MKQSHTNINMHILNSKKLDLEWIPFNEGWSLMKNPEEQVSFFFIPSRDLLWLICLAVACSLLIPPFLSVCGGLCSNLLPLMDSDGAPLHSAYTVPCLFLYIKALRLAWVSVCFPFFTSFTILSLLSPASVPSRCFHHFHILSSTGLHLLNSDTPLSSAVRSWASQISDRTSWIAAINLAGENSCRPIC